MTAERNEPVRIGLVGLGGHGRTIQGAAEQAAGLEVVAVCDVDEKEMAAAGRRFACETYESYEDLIQHENLEAVALTTPNALHRPQTEAALAAGLDVFVEKPIAGRVSDGLEMVKAAAKSNRLLAVGHNMRFSRSFVAAKESIEAGRIGDAVTMEIHFSADNILRLPPESWRLRSRECPVLPVMQLGIHAIDIMHFLLSPVRSIFASGRSVAGPPDVLDSVVATFQLADGLEGTLVSNYCTQIRFELRIAGTEGTLFLTPHRFELSRFSEGASETEAHDFSEFDFESYTVQMQAFAEAVRSRTRPPIDGWVGLKALAVVEAIDESIRSGKSEPVANLDEYQFEDEHTAA